ncbi:MAG: oligosaccharide flippase family protein [Anaerolineae bacterium]|jgi:O-antigen/teichoic acid export membrane protein|nr:oligosaccharide flippase family protein [Anaerolineae bacterium]
MLRLNTLILFSSNLGSAILAFALSLLIGRVFGQAGLGVYVAALAWVYPLALMVEGGIGTLVTREVARPDSEHSSADYLRPAYRSRLIFGGVVCIGMIGIAPVLSQDPQVIAGIRLSAPLIVIQPLFSLLTAVLRARQQMRPILLLNLGMLGAQVLLTTIAIAFGGDVLTALLINTLTSTGQVIAAWVIVPRETPRQSIAMISLSRRAVPFAIAGVLAALQMRVGLLSLEIAQDASAVGLLGAAIRFSEAWRILPNALFGALFPQLSAGRFALFGRVILALTGYGMIGGLIGTLFAESILVLTFGTDFADGASVLQLTLWAVCPALIRIAIGLRWYAIGREQTVNAVLALILAVQIGLSLWWSPLYGAIGAALAWVIAEIIGLVASLRLQR